MIISRIKLTNWKNFANAEAHLGDVNYIVGANASGKSNFLDVFRFLRDVAKPIGGGLQAAVANRGGFGNICSLSAEKGSSVRIEVDIADNGTDINHVWKYVLEIGINNKLMLQPSLITEEVYSYDNGQEKNILGNLGLGRVLDSSIIFRQTALEQEGFSQQFGELNKFFSEITYLHVVPQLIKFNAEIGGKALENDPFGQAFLHRIAQTPDTQRRRYLTKIQDVLKAVIPNIQLINFNYDTMRVPHLEVKYSNHNPASRWQTEEQFSDGTLRLISLFWQLLDGDNTLLLEEPELSLDEDVIRELPRMIDQLNRAADESKAKRQIIISTHSSAMLENKGIDARYVLRLETGEDGTKIRSISEADEALIRSGFSAAEVILPQVHPKNASKMSVS